MIVGSKDETLSASEVRTVQAVPSIGEEVEICMNLETSQRFGTVRMVRNCARGEIFVYAEPISAMIINELIRDYGWNKH
jgi:hypothetical protein